MRVFDWLKNIFSRPDVSSRRPGPAERSQVPVPGSEGDVRESLAEEDALLSECTDPMSRNILTLLKRSRRQQQLLEMIYEEHGERLAGISTHVREEFPCEPVFDFVEIFVLHVMHHGVENPELENIWRKFARMLDAQNLEVIIDQGEPFDPVRHQACDTRWNGKFPPDSVLEVVRPGLMIQGDVYRPALVVVNNQTHHDG